MAKHNFEFEAPDVVSEILFKDLLGHGYSTHILCAEDAFIRSNVWVGLWYLRAVSPDGTIERVMQTTRKKKTDIGFTLRGFKSLNGLNSYIYGLGYEFISVPYFAGGIRRLGPVPSTDRDSEDT